MKKGDKVRILSGRDIKGYIGGWAFSMNDIVGQIGTVESVDDDAVTLEEYTWVFDKRGLEVVAESDPDFGEKTVTITKDDLIKAAAKAVKNKGSFTHAIVEEHLEFLILIPMLLTDIQRELFGEDDE